MVDGILDPDPNLKSEIPNLKFHCAIGAVAAVCLGQPAQIFRGGVAVGVLDVIVTDSQGRAVEGLAKEDFEVTDEGARRDIVSVSFASIPIAPPQASPSSPSDVFTNSQDLLGRRTFVIVVDDLDTSSQDTMRTRTAAKSIVQALPDGDLVALAFTGQQTGAQEFTADKSRLLASVNRFVGRRPMFDDTDNVPLSAREFQPIDKGTQQESAWNLKAR